MVEGERLLIEAVNEPVPVPTAVWLPDDVGYCEVLQQTPRPVIVEPPSPLMVAVQVAEEAVILVAADRVIETAPLLVVKVCSAPYTVPVLLVA